MPAQISINTEKSPDQNIVANVNINVDQPILGAAFHLNYDPEYLQYLGYQEGDFFEQTPIHLVKAEEGTIYVGVSLHKNQLLQAGKGTLLKITFKPLQDGKTQLAFTDTTLSTLENQQRVDLPAEWQQQQFELDNVANFNLNFIAFILLGIIVFALTIAVFWHACKNKNNVL